MYDLNTRLLQTIVYVLNASHLSQVVIITTDSSFKNIEKKLVLSPYLFQKRQPVNYF